MLLFFQSPHIVTIDNASSILEAMILNFTSANNNVISHSIIIFRMDIMSILDWF
jgi:hypothetical protein